MAALEVETGTQAKAFTERRAADRADSGADKTFPLVLGSLMGLALLLFALFFRVGDADADVAAAQANQLTSVQRYYTFYIHVSIMIFVGFGFLMTFLKRYGYSAVGYNFMLSSYVYLWSIFCVFFWESADHGSFEAVQLTMPKLIEGLFAAGAVMISFGAVLGKVNPSQLVLIAFFEIIFYSFNFFIGFTNIGATDGGGSIFVHAFGAYFGMGLAYVMSPKNAGTIDHPYNGASYTSDMTSMIGTIFLWILWPSFNGALAADGNQLRVIIVTTLSLAGSCLAAFIASHFLVTARVTWESEAQFDMVHVQNATLAGGVAIGSCSDLVVEPAAAILIGALAGFLSTYGYHAITPAISKALNVDDTCGVHNLHGMPGVLGAVVSMIVVGMATPEAYGSTWSNTFDVDETPGQQVIKQLWALLSTLVIAVASGVLTGHIVKKTTVSPAWPHEAFSDHIMWEVPDDFVNIGQAQERGLTPKSAALAHTAHLRSPRNGGDVEAGGGTPNPVAEAPAAEAAAAKDESAAEAAAAEDAPAKEGDSGAEDA